MGLKSYDRPGPAAAWTDGRETARIAPVKREWSVYLVRCADGSLYTGIAKDAEARVAAHNAGRGAAYTRSRLPVRLVHREKGFTRSTALSMEARIKRLAKPAKERLLGKAFRRALAALAFAAALAAPAAAAPTFVKENPVQISSATPQSFTYTSAASFTYPIRMFYIAAVSSETPHHSSGPAILSATSADGLAWTAEVGTRLTTATTPSVSASSITACSVLPLAGGGFRMLYSIVSTTGAFRIHAATSADGLAWANEATVVADGSTTTFVGSPRLVALDSGDWRVYFVRDQNGGNDFNDRVIHTARSTDEGATWGAPAVALSTVAYELGAAKRTDGKVRLFMTQPVTSAATATVISAALSDDALGSSFAMEPGYLVSTSAASGGIAFPAPVRSTDSFRLRLYYTFFLPGVSTGNIHSALVGPPAPLALSPSTVFQSAAAQSFSISGEAFSVAPTVALVGTQATLNGAGVNRASDQSITATFSTAGNALGYYALRVTNADGSSTTVTNALLIDYAPGTVYYTDNLLRPGVTGNATFDITIFTPGRVTVKAYDLEGRLVRVLRDDDLSAGSHAVTWDGRTAAGGWAPSGVYLIHTQGPKINNKTKVILVR